MTSSLCNRNFLGPQLPIYSQVAQGSRKIAQKPKYTQIQCRYSSRQKFDNVEPARPTGPLMNEDIKCPTVRLLDQNQKMVGTCTRMEALLKARDAGLDLVMVSEDADPPVVRIVDYKKFLFDQQKRKKEQQKKSAATRSELKELKMRYNIDTHDYTVKMKAARGFLEDGHRVKLVVNFKGREVEFRDIGYQLLDKFTKDLGELAMAEKPGQEGRALTLLVSANKATIQRVKAQKAKERGEEEEATGVEEVTQSETDEESKSDDETEVENELSKVT